MIISCSGERFKAEWCALKADRRSTATHGTCRGAYTPATAEVPLDFPVVVSSPVWLRRQEHSNIRRRRRGYGIVWLSLPYRPQAVVVDLPEMDPSISLRTLITSVLCISKTTAR